MGRAADRWWDCFSRRWAPASSCSNACWVCERSIRRRRWGGGSGGRAAILMWVLLVIVVRGVVGVALQNYIPRRMTELVPHETIFEQIPTVVRGLRIEADERVDFITADLGLDEGEAEYQPA